MSARLLSVNSWIIEIGTRRDNLLHLGSDCVNVPLSAGPGGAPAPPPACWILWIGRWLLAGLVDWFVELVG